MKEIIDILVRRDGMTKSEARDEILYVKDMMQDAIDCGDYIEAEEIFMDELGLEPDYIFCLF